MWKTHKRLRSNILEPYNKISFSFGFFHSIFFIIELFIQRQVFKRNFVEYNIAVSCILSSIVFLFYTHFLLGNDMFLVYSLFPKICTGDSQEKSINSTSHQNICVFFLYSVPIFSFFLYIFLNWYVTGIVYFNFTFVYLVPPFASVINYSLFFQLPV